MTPQQKQDNKVTLYDGVRADSFLETFFYKKFARSFVRHNGDVVKAYKETFGETGEQIRKIFDKADAILRQPGVQLEMTKLMPSDKEVYDVYKSALRAPTPATIGWADKIRAADTMLKVKGHLGGDSKGDTTNNVIMVIEK